MSTTDKELKAFTVSVDADTCTVAINGTRYVYQSYDYSGYKLKGKFDEIAKHSQGKAVQWIKSVAKVVDKYGG